MSTRSGKPAAPQLPLRIAILGIAAFGVFAVLFLRLWFVQVLQGDDYLAKANSIRDRVVVVEAPRGKIVDRNGKDLVANKGVTVVTLESDAIPNEDRKAILNWAPVYTKQVKARKDVKDELARLRSLRSNPTRRAQIRQLRAKFASLQVPVELQVADATPQLRAKLAKIGRRLHVSTAALYKRVWRSIVLVSAGDVALKTGVPDYVRNYLAEHRRSYPGITVTREFVRSYPLGAAGAQIWGRTQEIEEKTLARLRKRGRDDLKEGQKIGAAGLEAQYDSYLIGRDGEQRVEVDAQNNPTGRKSQKKPVSGQRLVTSLDAGVQKTGFGILRSLLADKTDDKYEKPKRAAGAFVAMDPRNGDVLGMASFPATNPNIYQRDLSEKELKRLGSEFQNGPGTNRAIASDYSPGSTFKLVSATAGLAGGIITPEQSVPGGQCRTFGLQKQEYCNANKEDFPAMNLANALQYSSDVYFYDIGAKLFDPKNESAKQGIQRWSANFGFGKKTGIDLPGEAAGIIPSREWKEKRNAAEYACRKKFNVKNCFTVGDPEEQYFLGNNVNAAIGQGDVQTTPLQVVNAYAGLFPNPRTMDVNDGILRFPRPHLAVRTTDSNGRQIGKFTELVRTREVKLADPEWKRAIMTGLQGVTKAGTASEAFAGWNFDKYPVLGKTGTVQRACPQGLGTCADQAWFVGMLLDPKRPIVVAVTLESGNFGAGLAAPAVCRIIRNWINDPTNKPVCKFNNGSTVAD